MLSLCSGIYPKQYEAFLAGPKKDLLPRATTTHSPTINALQTTKITKLGLLPLPIGF